MARIVPVSYSWDGSGEAVSRGQRPERSMRKRRVWGGWSPPAVASLKLEIWASGNKDTGSGGTDYARFHSRFSGYSAEQPTIARQPSVTNAAHGPVGTNKRAIHFWRDNSDHLIADAVASLMNGADLPFTVGIYGRVLDTNDNGDAFTLSHSTGQAFIKFQLPGLTNRYRVLLQGNTGTSTQVQAGSIAAAGGHRLFMARRGPAGTQIYVGGNLEATSSATKGAATYDRCTIGGLRDSGGLSRPWAGQIISLMFWPNYALTEAERLAWETGIVSNT